MWLVDTSVWVDHFRKGNEQLAALLNEAQVCSHPYIIGELACGRMGNRREILDLMQALPRVIQAEQEEALEMVERNRLFGKGIGWIDVHLLCSALLTGVPLWTLDSRLFKIARELGAA